MQCANTYRSIVRTKPTMFYLFIVSLLIGIQGCTSQSNNRYAIKHDTAPNFDYGEIEYEDIIPVYEPYNIWTSRPYQVLGEYYTPLITGEGHEEEGNASWYGQKFHGHKTANGEIFDMFALSAAHKTLPLPSFVKVTNLTNNMSVTVRVNDRGPFHDDRIIDLSYGAAKKLGFHKLGVAKVKMEVIHVSQDGLVTIGKSKVEPIHESEPLPESRDEPQVIANQPSSPASLQSQQPSLFVQVMAMQNEEKIKSLALGLSNLLQVSTSTPKVANVYKLQLGPLSSEQKAEKLIQELYKIGFDEAFAVEVRP